MLGPLHARYSLSSTADLDLEYWPPVARIRF